VLARELGGHDDTSTEVTGLALSRSTDPLTAATTTIPLPSLRSLEFRPKTNRVIARLSVGILQFFDLQLSAYGGKDFCVNYASLSLFRPRDYLILQPGDRLRGNNRAEAWMPAASGEAADASMREVTRMAHDQALPFFESTKTVEGLLACLENENWGSTHHLNLEKACCSAKLGRLSQAQGYALRAIELYREDGRAWCSEGIQHCERLLSAILTGEADGLLRAWETHSIEKLRLQKLAR